MAERKPEWPEVGDLAIATIVRFYVMTAPKYGMEVLAENYKRAEEVLQKIAQGVVSNVVNACGRGTFRREN